MEDPADYVTLFSTSKGVILPEGSYFSVDLDLHTRGILRSNSYVYIEDLLTLDLCRPLSETHGCQLGGRACSPLIQSQWSALLTDHPDHRFAEYIVSGIQQGFRIGFNRQQQLGTSPGNRPSSVSNIISEYLHREVLLGRMVKLPPYFWPKNVHSSPIGIIPKKGKPGKWRLIVDLSSPESFSVNDGISRSLSSLTYCSVDHLSALVLNNGRGALLVKADVKEAYRMIKVHPDDCHLLGVQWENSVYIDQTLPFGLRSAPKIFSAAADAIQWILLNQGIHNLLHYLDDFILVAKDYAEATAQKNILIKVWEKLGVPMEHSKLEGPSQSLKFLGIEIDTVNLQLRLPEDKLSQLKRELAALVLERSVSKGDLESLVGLLQFATKVICPGRPFLRRLYTVQNVGTLPTHHVRLNVPAQADILWWHLFISTWNGISMLWDLGRQTADITLTSDASGSWGCGAFYDSRWFHFQWNSRLTHLPIATKEMIPIIISAAIFGGHWSGKIVHFHTDNMAVVHVVNALFCKDSHLMHLVRLLVFFASYHNFWFFASHIAGKNNIAADSLSRNNLSIFFTQVPLASRIPTRIPQSLLTIISQNITWTSMSWTKLFIATLHQL